MPDGVDYSRFVLSLIKIIQIQQKEINDLKPNKRRLEEQLVAI